MPVTSAQVRMARAALNWTVRDLSEATDLHRNTITNIETGRYAGDAATLADDRGSSKASGHRVHRRKRRRPRGAATEAATEEKVRFPRSGEGVRFRKPRRSGKVGCELLTARGILKASLRAGGAEFPDGSARRPPHQGRRSEFRGTPLKPIAQRSAKPRRRPRRDDRDGDGGNLPEGRRSAGDVPN